MPGTLEEVWAMGVRDPRRISVDRATGALWIADSGNGLREEINYETGTDPGGRNYGWDVTEGMLCNPDDPAPAPAPDCNDPGLTDPVLDLPAGGADCSVVGGHAYRGAHAGFRGGYFFADSCTGRVWSYDLASDSLTDRTAEFATQGMPGVRPIGLGEGGTGELYVMGSDGRVFEIRSELPACSDGVDNDADGLVDHPEDPGCRSPDSPVEVPLCDDGFDNDLDGTTDLDDPQCAESSQNVEAQPLTLEQLQTNEVFCGLGAELCFVVPLLMWGRGLIRPRRRPRS